jgi:REP-associated tyrosine transposase
MPYWRLFYHLIWATKDRAPLLDQAACAVVERSIRDTCEEPKVRLIAIGFMPDHVHLVMSIPPRIAIADFVGRLKGASSYAANGPTHGRCESRFAWQAEYGILSFGEKALPIVVDYVRNQPARHAANYTWPTLERTTDTS